MTTVPKLMLLLLVVLPLLVTGCPYLQERCADDRRIDICVEDEWSFKEECLGNTICKLGLDSRAVCFAKPGGAPKSHIKRYPQQTGHYNHTYSNGTVMPPKENGTHTAPPQNAGSKNGAGGWMALGLTVVTGLACL